MPSERDSHTDFQSHLRRDSDPQIGTMGEDNSLEQSELEGSTDLFNRGVCLAAMEELSMAYSPESRISNPTMSPRDMILSADGLLRSKYGNLMTETPPETTSSPLWTALSGLNASGLPGPRGRKPAAKMRAKIDGEIEMCVAETDSAHVMSFGPTDAHEV